MSGSVCGAEGGGTSVSECEGQMCARFLFVKARSRAAWCF